MVAPESPAAPNAMSAAPTARATCPGEILLSVVVNNDQPNKNPYRGRNTPTKKGTQPARFSRAHRYKQTRRANIANALAKPPNRIATKNAKRAAPLANEISAT
jgi:hypothetical protein